MEPQLLRIVVYRYGREIIVGQAEMLPDGKLSGSIDVGLLENEIQDRVVVVTALSLQEKLGEYSSEDSVNYRILPNRVKPFVQDTKNPSSKNYLYSPFTHPDTKADALRDALKVLKDDESKPLEDEDDLSPLEED